MTTPRKPHHISHSAPPNVGRPLRKAPIHAIHNPSLYASLPRNPEHNTFVTYGRGWNKRRYQGAHWVIIRNAQSPSNRDVSTGRGQGRIDVPLNARSCSKTRSTDGEGHHSRGPRNSRSLILGSGAAPILNMFCRWLEIARICATVAREDTSSGDGPGLVRPERKSQVASDEPACRPAGRP